MYIEHAFDGHDEGQYAASSRGTPDLKRARSSNIEDITVHRATAASCPNVNRGTIVDIQYRGLIGTKLLEVILLS